MKDCPCFSKKKYIDCCAPLHNGATPLNSTSLMRSRFCGYALNLSQYIIDSSHSNHKDGAKFDNLSQESIKEFSKLTEFRDLVIHDHCNYGEFETVTFTATLFQKDKDVSFTEKSTFKKEDGRFKYFSGEILVRP